MSHFNATFFLERNADVRGSCPPNACLYVQPDGGRSGSINFQVDSKLSPDEQVAIAEAFVRGVMRWRDSVIEYAERERTAADELVAAREEIARLKAERDGGEEA